jgi:YD repeat-containing protein
VNGSSNPTKYTYDITNKLTQITMPNGSIKQLTYDEVNQPVMEINTIAHPEPHIAEIVSSINFGSVMVGTPATYSLVVYNVGDGPLSINNVSTDNTVFTVSPQTAMIPPGGQATFTVTLTASAGGITTPHQLLSLFRVLGLQQLQSLKLSRLV